MTRQTLPFAIAVLALAPHALAQTAPPAPSVVARGEATVKRAPDQAWVTIAAESRATTAAEAQRLAAEAMTAVQKALVKAALPNDAIKTTNYSMQPDLEWTNGRSRVKGYVVRNEIEVRVDDMNKLSGVIDAAGSSGATSMSNLRFDLKDRAGGRTGSAPPGRPGRHGARQSDGRRRAGDARPDPARRGTPRTPRA